MPLAKEKFQSALTTTKEMLESLHIPQEDISNVEFMYDLLNQMLDMTRVVEVVINKATEEDQL